MEPSLSNSSMAAATERESYQAASTTKRFDCWRSFEGNPGHDQGHLGGGLTHQKDGERKGVFQQLIASVIVLETVGNVHDPKVPMKRRRRGGLGHVLSPKLGLLHQLCHQANHPHTKILCIQLVSLLWRAGNPARNAPGEFLRKKMAKSLQRSCLQCRVKSLRILWPK
ncbi:uncharacterized protein LOC126913667 isoform X3 [Cygnus atratus]|nr:uncharacterized protein LOC126913667 isoform X3 [Cygnus atratus]